MLGNIYTSLVSYKRLKYIEYIVYIIIQTNISQHGEIIFLTLQMKKLELAWDHIKLLCNRTKSELQSLCSFLPFYVEYNYILTEFIIQ